MKLRKDLLGIDIYGWAFTLGDGRRRLMVLLSDIGNGTVSQGYPASFYEQPPVGSFGMGIDDYENEIWGYLEKIDPPGVLIYKIGPVWCKSFTPGLPTDVDLDGMPLEVAE